MIVDQLRNELGSARGFGIAYCLVPVEDRLTVGIRIQIVVTVRPVALANNEIRNSVAVDIGIGCAVPFRKTTPPAFLVEKSSMIICFTNEIFPPASRFCSNHAIPQAMCVQQGNYIVQAVAVHIVYSHFAAAHEVAAKTAEYLRMIDPAFLTAAWRRLLPPTVWDSRYPAGRPR